MYCTINHKTKTAFKKAIKAWAAKEGPAVLIFSPGPFPPPINGRTTVEGPHYPMPHKWYASVILAEGKVISAT